MGLPLKVRWIEGLTLGPQQLQLQDAYHEARLQRFAGTINPYLWGVREAQWNTDALANNVLAADLLSLIFQDGEMYEAPHTDALPAPVDLGAIPAEVQSVTFYAALPTLKAHGGNVAQGTATRSQARYLPVEKEMPDLFGEALSIDVGCLARSVHLLSSLDSRADHLSFPVARVRRMVSGGFELDRSFFAPGLSIRAAPGLSLMLDNLLAKLGAKVEALYQRHRQPGNHVVEIYQGDLASFWMLHAVCAGTAGLTHLARQRQHHPEYLFDRLTAFAGGLMALSTRYALAELPVYEHENAAPGFIRLNEIIRDLLDTVISSRYFAIPLLEDGQRSRHYRAQLDPAKVDQRTRLGVAVSANVPALELVQIVPLRFKIAAPDDIDSIVNSALRGIELVHLPQVPAEVPVRPNTYYFSIVPKGQLYESMLKAQAMTIFVPQQGFDGLQLELFALSG
ncbi:type VI secretion system baseplate subunit TssK [Duganella callida]|uniref:Type VI secretion system baseplate subunit TssK n=1 Tax=Duganella callida TaxID=2561932 RepID=A0A4Y9T0E9_9BURK|nr:type VI secretion system baseplate subunit TssK [Duganella callida]TFW30373.1 type VI secretion system baseplate subunit TssK [Duganella callida]